MDHVDKIKMTRRCKIVRLERLFLFAFISTNFLKKILIQFYDVKKGGGGI